MLRNLQRFERLASWLIPAQLILIMGAVGILIGAMAAILVVLLRGGPFTPGLPTPPAPASGQAAPIPPVATDLAPTFTAEVQFWKPWILRWAKDAGLEPNLLATVIQIESCGHYLVGSSAGAQGLFQVIPDNFPLEDRDKMLDPEVNARAGIKYLTESLRRADGHIGLAMAGYNGGWGVIPRGWGRWVTETRNYYRWGSGIYRDALLGLTTEQSPALQSWLNAGGVNLCRQAAQVLQAVQGGTPSAAASPIPPAPLVPTQAPPAQPTIFIPPTITPSR
jgi:soluble lytic murein transglycosylase-like protein